MAGPIVGAGSWCSSSYRSFRLAVLALGLGIPLLIGGCGGGGSGSGSSGNSGSDGGTTATTPTPVVASISPTSVIAGSSALTLTVNGNGFVSSSVVQVGGTVEPTTYINGWQLTAVVSAGQIANTGQLPVAVQNGLLTSSGLPIDLAVNPPFTLTSLYPNAGPIRTAVPVVLQGTGFATSTTVTVNGAVVPSTWKSSTAITAVIPASSLATPGNFNVTVTSPGPDGGTAAEPFTAYVPIAANDIVFNPTDGLLYASVPTASGGASGNSVVGVDPTTGNVMRHIWVGSNPNKLALASDGAQLFVGLDGAGSVAQVDLTQGKVVNQFYLGGGEDNMPLTALYLAAVPGSPNSVAVVTDTGQDTISPNGNTVTIYDSGVARGEGWSSSPGPVSFGSSASTLYAYTGSTLEQLTVGSEGITNASALAVLGEENVIWIQYDNGELYLSTGQVLNASNGTLLGTLYNSSSAAATGPVVSDSTLGRAYVASNYYNLGDAVVAFDESSFNLLGSIVVNGAGGVGIGFPFGKIVRWGPNGVALNANTSFDAGLSGLFIFQSPLVQDLSSSPADLSVALTAPATGTTGTSLSWVATINNLGPNPALGASVSIALDPSLVISSVSSSTGSCETATTFSCDLGTFASGATATVTVNATPTQAGTLSSSAFVSSVSDDPSLSNNNSTASTTVTGDLYGAVPVVSSISPSLVQAGSSDFTLTVTGTGFNENSTINIGGTTLTPTFEAGTLLIATVPAASVANFGWAPVTVSNPSPGGGVSQVMPLTIYTTVNLPATTLLFDPWSQMLYATVPNSSTTLTGDSVVSVNPVTGAIGTPIAVGSQPTVMAETGDGEDLYIALSGADSLAQFNLLSQTVTATIPVSMTLNGTSSSFAPGWLAAMPGTDTTLAVGAYSNFGIFDIDGSTGSFRPDVSGVYEGSPVFGDASHVYAFSDDSASLFYRYSVDADGLTEVDSTAYLTLGSFQLNDGLLYGDAGIVDPSTTPPSQLAILPTVDLVLPNSVVTGQNTALAADPSLGKEFTMAEGGTTTALYALVRYDLSTYLPETTMNLPASLSPVDGGWTMLRWGQDGLALLATTVETNNLPQAIGPLILLRGPFVVPQELGSDTAATLAASSAATIAHGSGNTLLTLTGTNFQPGVAVTWNGSYRTTTIVDTSHVTVAIPASDLASAGSVSVVATNPGAAASNALTITID